MHSNIVFPSMPRLTKEIFPVSLTIKILKALILSPILAKFPAHLIIPDLITVTILG